MLPRAQRLSTAEFSRVFEESRVLRHPLLQLRVLRREAKSAVSGKQQSQNSCNIDQKTRAAFVVPKKIGKAVVRNQTRRRVRERYRLLQKRSLENSRTNQSLKSQSSDLINDSINSAASNSNFAAENAARNLSILKNCDLIWIISAPAQHAPCAEIDDAINQLLNRAARSVDKSTTEYRRNVPRLG